MNQIIEFMEESGFINQEQIIDIVHTTNTDDLYKFIIELKNVINKQNQRLNEHSPFCHLASPEVSGAGGCIERSCRLKRVDSFSLYSALYSDKAYINIDCINNPHFFSRASSDEYMIKYQLITDLLMINKLAPLINSDIVRIVKPEFMYCDDCIKKLLGECTANIDIDELETHYLDTVDIEIEYKNNTYSLNIKNLYDFFEHGSVIKILKSGKLDESLKLKVDNSPCKKYILTKQDIVEYGILKKVIKNEIDNVRRHLLESKTLGIKYLTSKAFDSHAMESSVFYNRGEDYIDVQQRIPIYNLPIISGISIENILRLRELEKDAFNNYRIALNKATKERIKHNTKKELIEINDEIIYPALKKLEGRLDGIRQGNYKKFFSDMLILGSTISLGLAIGLTPSDPVKILTALGGLSSLQKAGSKILTLGQKKEDQNDTDFYFLWRVKK